MKRIFFLLLILLFWSCNDSSVRKDDLHFLNGYWEISGVEFPDGSIKEYGMNTSVDFIQLKEDKGYRKKMKPQFDGTYDTSKDVEAFEVSDINETFTLRYKNEFSEWEEKLVQLDSVSFSVINQEGITYRYERFEPIKIPK